MENVKLTLEARLEQLTRRISRIDSELRTPAAQDSEDRATESENEEVLERLSLAEREELVGIRRALERIEAGTYSVCASCGKEIPHSRLEALPFTTHCVQCA
jgi:RNA polymerase-binding protein DksA